MMACPVCTESTQFRLLERYGDYKLYRCLFCDVVFSDPMTNPGGAWYEESDLYMVGKTFVQSEAWHHNQFLRDQAKYGATLFDIGCGTGAFLAGALKRGYQVEGIDFDNKNVSIARETFQLRDVHCMTLEAFIRKFPDKRFNVVTFFEVLEHMDDPNLFLTLVKRVAIPKGYIALSVPNRERLLDPLRRGDYPPNHLTRWSAVALRMFLENRGLEVIKLVVKELGQEDLAATLKSRIRLHVAHRMAKKGTTQHDARLVTSAGKLMKLKDRLFWGLTVPVAPFLKMLKLQGTGLYCLARVK